MRYIKKSTKFQPHGNQALTPNNHPSVSAIEHHCPPPLTSHDIDLTKQESQNQPQSNHPNANQSSAQFDIHGFLIRHPFIGAKAMADSGFTLALGDHQDEQANRAGK